MVNTSKLDDEIRRNHMAFVNEYISPEDVEKYQLEKIDKRFVVGGTNARDWTIDRARDIYIRNVAAGREDWRSHTEWTLYWKGDLIYVELELLTGGGGRGEPGWSHWKLNELEIPEHLHSHKGEILSDLKSALEAYKDGGVFSSCTDYKVILDIGENVQ
jgi:hypothetical protein